MPRTFVRAALAAAFLSLAGLSQTGCGPVAKTEAPPPPPEQWRDSEGRVILGSPHLTAGIPGAGPLRLDEIRAWLADPENHRPLEFVLPLGLDDAADLIQIPKDDPLTRAKIELGRQLFFDKRLAGFDSFSCSTCHQPRQFYTAHLVMPEVGRNASAAVNRLFSKEQFWDGKAASLEEQPRSPISNPFEMNTSPEACAKKLQTIEGYRLQFEKIYGAVTFENIGRALASFQRVLITEPTAWDFARNLRALEKKGRDKWTPAEQTRFEQLSAAARKQPFSEQARAGEGLFFSDRTRCGWCHTGPNLTDESYHNLGAGEEAEKPDPGRMKVTGKSGDLGAFKTPTLRNVARTAPFMHNGDLTTLEEAVAFVLRGGHPNPNLSDWIQPVELNREEATQLMAFLKSLNCDLPPVESGRLPPGGSAP